MHYSEAAFLMWLDEVKALLPPLMSVDEACTLYKLKLAQDEYIKLNKLAGELIKPVGKMTLCEKQEYYEKHILQRYDNDPSKVPPDLEPDWNEGWK